MSDILKKVMDQLEACIAPSYDDLEEALAVALQERNAFESMTRDMADWMQKCVVAHLKNDASGVKSVLDEFIAKHVKVVQAGEQSGSMH